MLREIGYEVQRRFFQPEAYKVHFGWETDYAVAKHITFTFSVIKKQISKPSQDEKNVTQM